MGFRDLHAFNLAMLAKQAWRLIHNTHSLFYRVYKARYFPNGSFMQAKLGGNPSLVWRSLLVARDILKEGARQKVGDGWTIGVATHNWLPRKPMFLHNPPSELRVCDLIKEDSRQWDRDKLYALFNRSTCEDILAIPLTQQHAQDSLVWKENKALKFSVQSAYQVALRILYLETTKHSSTQTQGATWRRIWKLKVPPKVRMFIQQACTNSLPTRDNLNRRHVSVEAHCEFCCQHPETATHMLWECPFTRNVQGLCKGRIQKCSNTASDFFLLFKHMLTILSPTEMDRWAIIAWTIQNARNQFCFEHIQLHP